MSFWPERRASLAGAAKRVPDVAFDKQIAIQAEAKKSMYLSAEKMHRSFASLRMTSERGQQPPFKITAHLFDALH